jgi:hypothetical protein
VWFAGTIAVRAGRLTLATAAFLFAMALRPAMRSMKGTSPSASASFLDGHPPADRTGWISPLIVRITLFDDSRMVLVYPGDLDSCNSLLRHLRRLSRDALIDGIPYRQYWGEMLNQAGERKQAPPPRYRVLRPEDEAEVERLYQRLKTVGNLDQKNSSDEK